MDNLLYSVAGAIFGLTLATACIAAWISKEVGDVKKELEEIKKLLTEEK